ncbi:MAG: CHRD domain-containing protein [Actinomycetota bacterium]|nr:CHRD domain-containing protein [Actinomycetota bacterium]
MRRLILFFVAACAIAVPAASAAPAKNAANDSGVMCVLHAKLSAEGDTGSTSMDTGKTKIKVLADGAIDSKTKIKNVDGETFVAAHIHQGAVGAAGPPVELLFSGSTSDSKIKQSGVATPLASTTGADICANPSGYYVNYHSTQFPDGSIRGQLG